MKKRISRIAIAREVIDTLHPMIVGIGTHFLATESMPEHYEMELRGLRIIFVPSVRMDPFLSHPQSVLDIWDGKSGKVFSGYWNPMGIVNFASNGWWERVLEVSPLRSMQ